MFLKLVRVCSPVRTFIPLINVSIPFRKIFRCFLKKKKIYESSLSQCGRARSHILAGANPVLEGLASHRVASLLEPLRATETVKRRTARRQAVSRKVEVIEPRNAQDGKDDVVANTEINMKSAIVASRFSLPRGLRAWHVGQCEYVVTRETLKPLTRR